MLELNTENQFLRKLRYQKFANFLAPFSFLWIYLCIIAAIVFFHEMGNIFVKFLLILFVTDRYRRLEELSHMAIHGSLYPNKKMGLWLANLLFQFPLFEPSIFMRDQRHVIEQHSNINSIGIKSRIFGVIYNFYCNNKNYDEFLLRTMSVMVIVSIFISLKLYFEFIFLYLFPIIAFFPQTQALEVNSDN